MVAPAKAMNMLVTFLLVAIFAAAGVMKLTPILSPEIHNEMRGNFQQFVAVPPITFLQLQADVYRTLVGVVELGCITCLLCPHSKVQLIGHYILLVVMLGAIWTHFYINDTVDKMIPAISCLALLLLRLYTSGKVSVKVKTK